ncbi:hypothetical protein ACFLSE_06505 [Bacteroidota bacterium]
MKTKKLQKILIVCLLILLIPFIGFSQDRASIAVIGIDCRGIKLGNLSMENLVRLELEKSDIYEVLDKYDAFNILNENGVDVANCYGKTKLVEVGELLGVDKILTGNVDKFGDKIIYVFRMIDVKSKKIEKTNVMEYLDLEEEIQTMTRISMNYLLGIENDPLLVDLLINYDQLVSSPKTTVKLNGPRMGASITTGETGQRLGDPLNRGGYNMYPVTSIFGYQYEIQYLSSGDFQALIEAVGAISGLEAGNFIPSISLMNGFRFNKRGWEIGVGPIFRLAKVAEGYYDNDGNWNLAADMPIGANYDIVEGIDSRGDYEVSTSLIIAFGKTFRSGYLNVPLNIYYVPKKEGSTIGLVFGFNIAKKTNGKRL